MTNQSKNQNIPMNKFTGVILVVKYGNYFQMPVTLWSVA